MGKSVVKRTKEESKERHEFRKLLREKQQEWEQTMFKEQLDEVRSTGLRNNNQE
jgi:hypothetical protein